MLFGQFWNGTKWKYWLKNFFLKLNYLISRVFWAWTFSNFLAYCVQFIWPTKEIISYTFRLEIFEIRINITFWRPPGKPSQMWMHFFCTCLYILTCLITTWNTFLAVIIMFQNFKVHVRHFMLHGQHGIILSYLYLGQKDNLFKNYLCSPNFLNCHAQTLDEKKRFLTHEKLKMCLLINICVVWFLF